MPRASAPRKPARPWFASGPCPKPPDWRIEKLADVCAHRYHRAPPAQKKIHELLERSTDLLAIPDDYITLIVPGSASGAFETALWSLLGPRPITALVSDHFSRLWAKDLTEVLDLRATTVRDAPFGDFPDTHGIDPDNDVIFVWNGTTSGVCVPTQDWLDESRRGLLLCDAAAAAFIMPVPVAKLDVMTWSWQKGLGGEAGFGMISLSPKAQARLSPPPRPVPLVMRIADEKGLRAPVAQHRLINTLSMLAAEDALTGLRWAQEIGGREALMARTRANADCVSQWLANSSWAQSCAVRDAVRSPTPVCIIPRQIADEPNDDLIDRMVTFLAEHEAAFDVRGYRAMPPHLRLWCGPTVETADLRAALDWLDWSYTQCCP
ncbi:MAG: aminotransferase class V-fold PLP-dependent enzyme [Pseudomonadota bacterium]